MQRIAGDDAAFERQHSQHFQRTFGLVAAGRLARGQRQPGFCRKTLTICSGVVLLPRS